VKEVILWLRIVERNPLDEYETRYIFKQLLEAVRYLHEHGIAHRDLKPENVLFRTKAVDSAIVLADFGFAKRVPQSEGLMESDVGTPDYAAPEILKQSYRKDVDSWALGCIVYCMLYGIPPFYGEDCSETLEKITRGDPIVFYEDCVVSNNAKDLILKLLDRNPRNRLTVGEALHHAWIHGPTEVPSGISRERKINLQPKNLKDSLTATVDYDRTLCEKL